MATSELKPSSLRSSSSEEENLDDEGFETEECVITDDSDEDPTFDVLEEMRSRFSRISLKKTRPRLCKKRDDGGEEEMEAVEVEVPQLDDKDRKCFENVEKMIKNGQVNKVKVDQCKVYLRKYGLRLTGNKDILIGRIREHLEVIDGAGEKKYPISSFVINCQGDACTGEVLMFEQKVYEMYSIASRSATGPPCGTRIIAGRVVKESYGAAKQQHTFTVEVLWSKGEKPLPPLHPLLIKGRNLYRLKTVRQKWADEEERRKVLQEKHMRGSAARYSRDIRVQGKEMRKLNRGKSLRVTERKGNNKFMPEQLAQLQLSRKPIEYQYHHPNHMTYTGNQNIQSQNHPIFTEKQSIAEEPRSCIFQAIDKQLSNSFQAIKPTVTEKHDNSIPQVPNNYDAAQVIKKQDPTSIAAVLVQNLKGFSDRLKSTQHS